MPSLIICSEQRNPHITQNMTDQTIGSMLGAEETQDMNVGAKWLEYMNN